MLRVLRHHWDIGGHPIPDIRAAITCLCYGIHGNTLCTQHRVHIHNVTVSDHHITVETIYILVSVQPPASCANWTVSSWASQELPGDIDDSRIETMLLGVITWLQKMDESNDPYE